MDNIVKDKFKIIGIDDSDSEKIARPRINYWQDAWRRLKENKMAIVALIILVILFTMVIIGPTISGYSFEEIDPTGINQLPSSKHWFGTDELGRDIFARVWQAGRISLLIGLSGAFIGCVVGCIYGGIAAYFGGIVDDIMMRIVEILSSIPYVIVVILISVITDSKSISSLMIALTLTGWCGIA